jgi:hypothetical protein
MKELDFVEALLQEQAERLEREPPGEITFTLPTTPPTASPIQEQEQEQITITPIQEQRQLTTTLTQEQLRQEIHYDPETGIFMKMSVCRGGLKPKVLIGNVKSSSGYLQIRISGKVHQAHRLAWFYMTGRMPDFQIIHVDGIKHNNRWGNLERRTSIRVDKKAGSEHGSGVMGVTWVKDKSKWRARIRINDIDVHLGMFKELNDAIEAREEANAQYALTQEKQNDEQ